MMPYAKPIILLGFAAMAIAVLVAVMVLQVGAEAPEDISQLSEQEKLNILNSGDEAAVRALMEAEEASSRAAAKQQRIEQQKILAEAKMRGREYWRAFDAMAIDLSGFNFNITKIVIEGEMRSAFTDQAQGVTNFERAEEVVYSKQLDTCDYDKNKRIRKFLKSKSEKTSPFERADLSRISDYLSDRAALETGDCSCATQIVPPEKAWALLENITKQPGYNEILDADDRKDAIGLIGSLFGKVLREEKRKFCHSE